jgi:hypothetical protein
LSNLHRIALEFRDDISFVLGEGGTIMMSARIRRPIGSVAFVSALLVSTFGAGPRAGTAAAADCLAAPNSSAPPNSHWYYRTDRTTQRKCWYLRASNDAPQQGALKTAQAAPAANEYSFASFKEFMTQRGNARLSDADIERLYAEFQEWRRHPGNGVKERQ